MLTLHSMRRILALIVLVFALSSSRATASPITYVLNGSLTGHGLYAPLFPAGTPITIVFSYDTNSPNACPPGSGQGFYVGATAVVSVSGHTFNMRADLMSGGTPVSGCGGGAPPEAHMLFGPEPTPLFPNPNPPPALLPFPAFWYIYGLYAESPGALPHFGDGVSLLSNEYPGGHVNGGHTNYVTGSAQARVIPEPATILFVGTGAVAICRRRRR
jgi:hypothetical protein